MTGQEKLLWAAFERIKAHPEEYSQMTFYTRSSCGTVGCLAYHICLAADEAWLKKTVARTAVDGFGAHQSILGTAASMSASEFMGFKPYSPEYDALFGLPGSYNVLGEEDKVAWLENHIKSWLACYGNKLKPGVL